MKTKNKFKFLRKTKNTIKKYLIFLLFISFFIFSSNTTTKSEIITNKTIETVINENTEKFIEKTKENLKDNFSNKEKQDFYIKNEFYVKIYIMIRNFIKNTNSFYTINDKLIIKTNLEQKKSKLEKEKTNLEKRIKNLENKIKQKDKEISDLKNQLKTNLEQQKSKLEQQKSKLEQQKTNLENRIKNSENIFSVFYSNTDKTEKIEQFKDFLKETFRNNNITKKNKELEKWNWNDNFYFVFNKNENNNNYKLYKIIFTEKDKTLENSNKILTLKIDLENNYLVSFDNHKFYDKIDIIDHFVDQTNDIILTKTNNSYKNQVIKKITKLNKNQTKENKKETKEKKKETKENKKETKQQKKDKKKLSLKITISIIVILVSSFIIGFFIKKWKNRRK